MDRTSRMDIAAAVKQNIYARVKTVFPCQTPEDAFHMLFFPEIQYKIARGARAVGIRVGNRVK